MDLIDIMNLDDAEFAALGGITVQFDWASAAAQPRAAEMAVEVAPQIAGPQPAALVVAAALADPRDANCKALAFDASGKLTGLPTAYAPLDGAEYDLEYVKLIDEATAQGNTVFMYDVLDAKSGQIPEQVWMAWPWPENQARCLPGNPNREHTMTSKFPGDGRLGPLFFYVGDAAGKPKSGITAGWGLRDGRHYCGYARWRKAEAVVTPDPEPEPEPEPTDGTLAAAVKGLTAAVIAQTEALNQVFRLKG